MKARAIAVAVLGVSALVLQYVFVHTIRAVHGTEPMAFLWGVVYVSVIAGVVAITCGRCFVRLWTWREPR